MVASLPTEILDLIAEQLESDKFTLSSLSLLNKQFSCSARRKLWEEIAIIGEETDAFIYCIKCRPELGNFVKDLSLVSRVHLSGKDTELVEAQQLVKLLKSLPNLALLDIDSVVLQPLRNLDGMDFKLNFDLINLTTFEYILMDKQTGLHFLRKIITRAINLKNLDLKIQHITRTFQPIKCYGNLSSLQIRNDTSVSLLDLARPLISLTTSTSLKEFTYEGPNDAATSIGMLELLQQSASTLETLHLYSAEETSFRCVDFIPLFSNCKLMTSLKIPSLTGVPHNFFEILPPSLLTLESASSVDRPQLLHLRKFPLPHLKLKTIKLVKPDYDGPLLLSKDIVALLPPSIEIITFMVLCAEGLEDVLSAWDDIKKFTNIRRIIIHNLTHDLSDANDAVRMKERFLRKFKKFAVELEIGVTLGDDLYI